MEWIKMAIQVFIAFSIYNVWFLRVGKQTSWRGANARSMKEEFKAYGLPIWFMYLVGFLKVTLATLLVVGVFYPVLITPAATGMALLMTGAIIMHIKVKDALLKSFPAFSFLVLSLVLIFLL